MRMLCPATLTGLTPKSTPMVEMYLLTNFSSQKRLTRQLLPTASLPKDG
jgi:hypothetical protein